MAKTKEEYSLYTSPNLCQHTTTFTGTWCIRLSRELNIDIANPFTTTWPDSCRCPF